MTNFAYAYRSSVIFIVLYLFLTVSLFAEEKPVLLYAPAATVSRFEASARVEDGQVRIYWQTTAEFGMEAFRVLRQRNDGVPELVAPGYLRSQGDETGGTYELADPVVRSGEKVRYRLLIVSPDSSEQQVAEWSGIVGVTVAPQPIKPLTVEQDQAPRFLAVAAKTWIGSDLRVRPWTNSLPADRVRLSLRKEGVYGVSAQELADAGGWNVGDVAAAISSRNFTMSCQGLPVAWLADGENLLFYGVPAEPRFAPENVYWVAPGAGSVMASRVMTPRTPAITNEWFADRIVHQGTDYLARVSYSSLADSPASYVAFPGPLLAGGVKSYNETLTDRASGVWTGAVTVNLLSYYEAGTDEHAARVSLGGTTIGESSWSGEQYVSFTYPFSSTNLTGSMAALNVLNIGSAPPLPATDSTRFLCMSYSFFYSKLYLTRNGALRCRGGAGNTVAVSGFASNDVLVMDVTVTNQPGLVEPVTITYDSVAGTWTASFPCEGSEQIYQVFSKSDGILQPAVRGVRDVDWSSPTNAADNVILIPPEAWRDDFRAAMQPLADYRNSQGLQTRIVDVESLYNRYSYGLVDPLAIRAFCADGRNWPEHPLRFVLLAGAGALDFKHQRLSVKEYTACLIPPLIAGQRFASGEGMTVAIDAALGDVNGDGVPEVAIGRLPTTKTLELGVIVQKTIAYEGGVSWKKQALVAADWNNTGIKFYKFSVGTDRLIEPLENDGRTVLTCYPIDDTGNLSPVKVNTLFPALSAGSGMLHFFGHTDEQNLGGGSGKLLRNADIATVNWQKPTIMAVIGCRPNRWQSLTTTTCILPYGLFAADTGFVACLGATGYMLGEEGEDLALNLYSDWGAPGIRRMGDVWRRGLQLMVGAMPADRLQCFSLIGDPALVFNDTYALTATAADGTVTKFPDSSYYNNGASVTLTATPNAGYHFTGWCGDATGTNNPVSVIVTQNMSVTAGFALNVITVLTDRATLSVPEGSTLNFQVKLSAQPTNTTCISIARQAMDDSDLFVASETNLMFSDTNWDNYQTVTLEAAEDNGDNDNGTAFITCSGTDVMGATVVATEIDDDYILTATAISGMVTKSPDLPYYDRGTSVVLTALPHSLSFFTGWTGDLFGTNNPASITMDGNKSVRANFAAAIVVLPPKAIGKKSFVARWKWAEGGAPEGELSVASGAGFASFVPGYESRYVANITECGVTNLAIGQDYWYKLRRLMPDGSPSPWSLMMKVKTGRGIPTFCHLLSDVPVSKGVSQKFAVSNLVSGSGSLKVNSSNTNAVKVKLTAKALMLQYLWKGASNANVTLTLTHPETGYKTMYKVTVSRARGNVAIRGLSALTNAGARVVQEITLENRTGDMVYGVRVRALGLDQAAWLINRTDLDPVSKAPIREIPCVLPAGSQIVVRLVYDIAYKKQARTRQVTYGAWAIMPPVTGIKPVTRKMIITQQDLYDGLCLLGLPANRNRLYTVYHSDDDGATWTLNVPVIRATANYLMWLDTDEGAPSERIYRVVDAGM